MHRSKLFSWAMFPCVMALTASGCGAAESPGSVEVFAITPDASGHYGIRRVPLPVRDPHTLACDELSFIANASIEILGFTPGSATITDARPVNLSLVLEDGAFAATDFDGLIALTATHHLLTARRYFDDLGLRNYEPAFPSRRVALFPTLRYFFLFGGPTSDNAFFADGLDGFGIVREIVLDELPLAANLGVMSHEFAHAVFAHLSRTLPGLDALFPGIPFAVLFAGLNEGLADVHGATVTGDPDFLHPSVPSVSGARNLAIARVYDVAALIANRTPYGYGSIVASSFWGFRTRLIDVRKVSEPDARMRMARVAFEGLRDMQIPPGAKTQGEVENGFWSAARASAKRTGDDDLFCDSLKQSFPPASRTPSNPLPSAVCP